MKDRTDAEKERLAEMNRIRQRRFRAKRAENAVCVRCGKPGGNGKSNSRCPECQEERRKQSRELVRIRRERGLCACGKPRVSKRMKCQECLDRYREIQRRSYHERPSYKRLVRKSNKEYRERIRRAVLRHYGSICACCGEDTPEFLQIDHVNNDGNEHRKEIGVGGISICIWLQKNGYPDGFQILCANCNFAKGKYGECPHKELVRDMTLRECDHDD